MWHGGEWAVVCGSQRQKLYAALMGSQAELSALHLAFSKLREEQHAQDSWVQRQAPGTGKACLKMVPLLRASDVAVQDLDL